MELINREKCTGCAACLNACNIKAISFEEDERGFLYPRIDNDICIQCGSCVSVCPEKKYVEKCAKQPIYTYAAINHNELIHHLGSSGSVFYELAKAIIDKEGVVYGCAWQEDLTVCHTAIYQRDEIGKLLKSKYVQSSIGLTYINVEKELNRNKLVLFSGTPCQVAGLKSFLNKKYDNLICVDVVCHGIPNQKIFLNYIDSLENKENGKVTSYSFREKYPGIGNYATSYTIDDNRKIVKQWTLLSYSYLFMNNYLSRDSCYSCQYATRNRISDITLGDFWGINQIDSSFDNDKGVSAVIINSENGKVLFSEIECKLKLLKVPYEDIFEHNSQLNFPANKPSDRDWLWDRYVDIGYEAFDCFYRKTAKKVRVKSFLKLLLLKLLALYKK